MINSAHEKEKTMIKKFNFIFRYCNSKVMTPTSNLILTWTNCQCANAKTQTLFSGKLLGITKFGINIVYFYHVMSDT